MLSAPGVQDISIFISLDTTEASKVRQWTAGKAASSLPYSPSHA